MFSLKSGNKIDESGICNAMANSSVLDKFFFDTETGKVVFVSIGFDSNCNEVLKKVQKNNKKYIEILKVSDSEKHSQMKEFINLIVGEGELKDKLNFVLSQSQDFYIFERILEKDKDGFIHDWVQWKYDYFFEKMEEWLKDIGIELEEESPYFDDCPVCQFMKKIEDGGESPKLGELKKVFQEARKNNDIDINKIDPQLL